MVKRVLLVLSAILVLAGPLAADSILLESGDHMLLESGDLVLLEVTTAAVNTGLPIPLMMILLLGGQQ